MVHLQVTARAAPAAGSVCTQPRGTPLCFPFPLIRTLRNAVDVRHWYRRPDSNRDALTSTGISNPRVCQEFHHVGVSSSGTEDRSRTCTPLRALRPERSASAKFPPPRHEPFVRNPGIEPGVPACHTGAFTKLARRAQWDYWESNPAGSVISTARSTGPSSPVSHSSTVGESSSASQRIRSATAPAAGGLVAPLGIEPSMSVCRTDAFTKLAQGP